MDNEANLAIVNGFVSEWQHGLGAIRQSFSKYLTDDVLYENVGLTKTTSLAEAIDLIDNFLPGLDHIVVDLLAESASGDVVFNERVDHLRGTDGSTLMSIRVAGVFEIRHGRISGWRDYFHTAPLVNAPATRQSDEPTAIG